MHTYDSRQPINVNDVSRFSSGGGLVNDMTNTYDIPRNDNSFDKNSRTPSKFITLQPCPESSSKK